MTFTGTPVARATAPAAVRLRLRGGARTALRAVHVVFSGGWLGLSAGMLTLGLSAALATDAAFATACYTMMDRFGVAIPIFAIGTVLSGVLLSLATRWGLVRYWWIVVKTVLALATIVTAIGLAGAWRQQVVDAYDQVQDVPAWLLVGSSGLHLVTLGLATVISVGKPWGQIRARWVSGRTRRSGSRGRPESRARRPRGLPVRADRVSRAAPAVAGIKRSMATWLRTRTL